jgi:hypothetical protein
MKSSLYAAPWAFLIVVVASVAFFSYSTGSVQNCIDKRAKHYQERSGSEKPPGNLFRTNATVICIGHLLEAYSGALSALAALSVSVLTIALVQIGHRQAEHSRVAAASAVRGVEIVRDSAQRELRAYLTVHAGTIDLQINTMNRRFEAHPLVHNSGQTPAYNVRFRIGFGMLPLPLPPTMDLFLGPDDPNTGDRFTLPSKGNHNLFVSAPRMYSDEEVRQVNALDGNALYVYGQIAYEDIFRREWRTNFSYYIILSSIQGVNDRWMTSRYNDAT